MRSWTVASQRLQTYDCDTMIGLAKESPSKLFDVIRNNESLVMMALNNAEILEYLKPMYISTVAKQFEGVANKVLNNLDIALKLDTSQITSIVKHHLQQRKRTPLAIFCQKQELKDKIKQEDEPFFHTVLGQWKTILEKQLTKQELNEFYQRNTAVKQAFNLLPSNQSAAKLMSKFRGYQEQSPATKQVTSPSSPLIPEQQESKNTTRTCGLPCSLL